MTTSAGDSYDALPYPSYPFAITHPARLHVLASLAGVDPPSIERARVLELGCASGGNLIPIAVDLPATRCLGIDASKKQIDEGRALVSSLGLGNCELLHGDIAALGPELGEFDYIVCHGVYSWVPRHVQDAILGLCGRALSPGGVAYVSYNTYPGWRMRSMIRDMMRYHARQFDDPKVAVAQSRRLLDYLAKNVSAERGAYTVILNQELGILRKQSDAYLYHEHLEANNEPLYFHQFVERAEAAGLAYLGEATLGETRSTLFPEMGEDSGRGTPAAIQADQYRDFVLNRLFRTTMLCRRDRRLGGAPVPEDVTRFLVATRVEKRGEPAEGESPAPPDTPPGPEYVTLAGKLVRVHTPIVIAALDLLTERWPRAVAFDELVAAVQARAGAEAGDPTTLRARLAEQVLEMYADDHIELRPHQVRVASEVSARPQAHPLARAQAETELVVSNARHEPHELDRYDRELVRALDGQRDLAALGEVLIEAVGAGRLDVTRDGEPVTDAPTLREVFEKAIPVKLRALLRRSLLVG